MKILRSSIEPLEARIAPATFLVTVLTDVTDDDGQLTLREAVAAAQGTTAADTIKFDPALAGLITLAQGQINITETLTIIGGGKITISGNDTTRIFNADNVDDTKDHPLTVSGLNFVRGKAGGGGNGGAIRCGEGLTILNCTFSDSTADNQGGAVYASSATGMVIVKGSHFSDNTSTSGAGGLHATSLKGVTVTGSVFDGNEGGFAGGAYLSSDSNSVKITVTGSTFSNNEASGSGGGLSVSAGKVSISNSQFIGNTADFAGGGLSIGGGIHTYTGLKFFGNSAPKGGAISSAAGAKSITISKSLFEGNEATAGKGGGIYLTGGVEGFAVNISGTQLIANKSSSTGGGMVVLDTGGKITITGSLLSGNSASRGGGLSVEQNNADDLVVTLTGNTVTGNSTTGGGGGLSLFRYGGFILTKNVISGNVAGGTAGVDFDLIGEVTMKANQVVGNRSSGGIGGIYFLSDAASSFTNSGNVIAHNVGSTTGGLDLSSAAAVTIAKDTKIYGNIGGTTAGGVSEDGSGTVTLLAPVLGNHNRANAAFDQTNGTFAGPSIPLPSVAATFTVTNLNDSGPGSLRDAIAQANATPAADKIKFDDALRGVITLASELAISEPLTIYGRGAITLSGNDATRILKIDNADSKDRPVTVSGLTFTKGKDRGAAISTSDTLTILDCLFVSNKAGMAAGGAVTAELVNSAITVKNSGFVDNSGGVGGALFASSSKAMTIDKSVFLGNADDTSGGAARLVAGLTTAKISVTGSLFQGNSSFRIGGALSIQGMLDGSKSSKASVVNSNFFNNTAAATGGGLQLNTGGFTLSGLQVIGNASRNNGGGLHVEIGGKQLAVSKSIIAKNTAGDPDPAVSTMGGGAVYLGQNSPGFTATFTTTQILGNTAGDQGGGGLLADGITGKLTFTGSIIADNSADVGGGLRAFGLGDTSTALALTGNLIAGNEAQTGGGLSTSGDGAVALSKNVLLANHATTGGGGGVLQSSAKIALQTNSILANRADSTIGGLLIDGPVTATFSTSGDLFAFNEGGTTGGLQIGSAIAGIIAKSVKITGNIGSGAIYGGGVTQESTNEVKLLATVLGNLNRTHPAHNETFGLFAP